MVRRGRLVVGGRGGDGIGERQTLRVSETRKVLGRSTAEALNLADSAERVRCSAGFSAISASAVQAAAMGGRQAGVARYNIQSNRLALQISAHQVS